MLQFKKVALMGLCSLALCGVANAQLGGFLKKPGSSAAASENMSIGAWIDMANEAQGLLDNSSSLLLEALADKAKVDEINAMKKAMAEAKDDKAKKEMQVKIAASTNAALMAVDADKAAEKLAAEKDQKKVKNVGAAAYNFVLGVLKDKKLLDSANATIDSAKSNPASLKDVSRVREVVSSTSSQMSSLMSISGNMPKLAKVAKVELPKSETETAKEIDSI